MLLESMILIKIFLELSTSQNIFDRELFAGTNKFFSMLNIFQHKKDSSYTKMLPRYEVFPSITGKNGLKNLYLSLISASVI